jgi:hypothetical protein
MRKLSIVYTRTSGFFISSAVLNMNKTKAVPIQLAGSRKETVKAKSAESTGQVGQQAGRES